MFNNIFKNKKSKNIKKSNVILFGIVFLLMMFLFGGKNFVVKTYADDATTLTPEEQAALDAKKAEEEKLAKEKDKVKDNIKDLNKKLDKKIKQKENLEQNLTAVQRAVYSTKKAINNTQSEIEKTEETIQRKEEELKLLEENKKKKTEILKKMVQEVYANSQQPFLYIVFEKDNFIDNATSVDNFFRMKEKIMEAIDEVKNNQKVIDGEKQKLAKIKDEKNKLLGLKVVQKKALDNQKIGLQVEVNEKMASIKKIQSKLSALKNDLNKILGKSYNTGDVKDAIKFANKSTGVRKGFLFGMLSVESRLGASVGGCNYKESRMSSYRKTIFKDICKRLGYNYKKRKVSCPPRSYKGTGGAMGAAQFMSDTWKGYESSIASHTGHSTPDPWNLVDGVMAMALKLKNDGATKSGKVRIVNPCNRSKKIRIKWEEYASMKYLGWSCYGLTHYAKSVQSLSGNYNKL